MATEVVKAIEEVKTYKPNSTTHTSACRLNLILTAGENDRVENRTPADDWPKSLE